MSWLFDTAVIRLGCRDPNKMERALYEDSGRSYSLYALYYELSIGCRHWKENLQLRWSSCSMFDGFIHRSLEGFDTEKPTMSWQKQHCNRPSLIEANRGQAADYEIIVRYSEASKPEKGQHPYFCITIAVLGGNKLQMRNSTWLAEIGSP